MQGHRRLPRPSAALPQLWVPPARKAPGHRGCGSQSLLETPKETSRRRKNRSPDSQRREPCYIILEKIHCAARSVRPSPPALRCCEVQTGLCFCLRPAETSTVRRCRVPQGRTAPAGKPGRSTQLSAVPGPSLAWPPSEPPSPPSGGAGSCGLWLRCPEQHRSGPKLSSFSKSRFRLSFRLVLSWLPGDQDPLQGSPAP